MTEQYQVPILELLTIPNDATRWIIIKKALAAEAQRNDTKAVEFAYGSLAGAEKHLIRINDESSEFLVFPVDLEPYDDSDKFSGGPKLQTFAKKHGTRKTPIVYVPPIPVVAEDDEDEELDLETVSEPAAGEAASEVVEHEVESAFSDEEAPLVDESVDVPALEDEKEQEIADEPELAAADPVEKPFVETVETSVSDASAGVSLVSEDNEQARPASEIVEDVSEDRAAAPASHEAILKMFAELEFEPSNISVEEVDARIAADLDAMSAEAEARSQMRSRPAEAVPVAAEEPQPTESETFRIYLDAVVAVSDDRARWIMLKKLMAFVRKRKYVRSLTAEDLRDEAHVIDALRLEGGIFDIPIDGEPNDHTDSGASGVSLRDFAAHGWTAPAVSQPVRKQRRPRQPPSVQAEAAEATAGSMHEETPPVEHRAPEEAVEVAEQPSDISTDLVLARFDILLDDGVNAAISELSALDDETVLRAAAEVLARRLELEAANLRLRVAAKAYRN